MRKTLLTISLSLISLMGFAQVLQVEDFAELTSAEAKTAPRPPEGPCTRCRGPELSEEVLGNKRFNQSNVLNKKTKL